jgi:hypothetical protein
MDFLRNYYFERQFRYGKCEPKAHAPLAQKMEDVPQTGCASGAENGKWEKFIKLI